MKIKSKELSFAQVKALPEAKPIVPKKPNLFFRSLVRLASIPDLRAVKFSFTDSRREELKDQPSLILMNHSSFLDLEIASRIFYPKPYAIICTSDGFVGKKWLLRNLGCIPTRKFVTNPGLISEIRYALSVLCESVLMYPEASYSFDGTATPLPRRMGVLLKRLKAPVTLVKARGSFLRDPLYNGLQKRKVEASAEVSTLFTPQELSEKTVEEIDSILDQAFSYDHFADQRERGIEISETFRADHLERVLYKCPYCGKEGFAKGEGILWRCDACGAEVELDPFGALKAKNRPDRFESIPQWYRWEREEVKKEIENGSYRLETPVRIGIMKDYKAIYFVGFGELIHDCGGFRLTGCAGALSYLQPPAASYGLYSDFYWYEIGDVICIGNSDMLYYCFPEKQGVVAKARLAAEELYKRAKGSRRTACETGSGESSKRRPG